MKLNHSKKILILAIPIFFLVLILNIVFVYLLLSTIDSVNNKVRQLNISSQKREEELLLKGLISSFSSEREKLSQYFIGMGNADVVAFTKYLEDLALNIGVSQKKTLAYEPMNELKDSETVSTIRFRFSISGKWSNVFNFLQLLENLPKVTNINSVSMFVNSEAVSIKEIKSGSKVWSADIDFSVVKLKI